MVLRVTFFLIDTVATAWLELSQMLKFAPQGIDLISHLSGAIIVTRETAMLFTEKAGTLCW